MNKQIENPEQRQLDTGKVGFNLAIVAFPTLSLSILPSLVFCIMGIVRKKSLKLAIIGLLLNIISFYVLLKISPSGFMPYPLNILKFKVNCPEDAFWLKYDNNNIVDVQSFDMLFDDYGAVHFCSEPDTYSVNDVRKYAEANGWVYDSTVTLSKNDFENYRKWNESKNGGIENYNHNIFWILHSLFESPIVLQEDCTVLAFNTSERYPDARYIMISKDLSEMVVFINNPIRPDPAEYFDVPNEFKALEKEQKNKEILLINDNVIKEK